MEEVLGLDSPWGGGDEVVPGLGTPEAMGLRVRSWGWAHQCWPCGVGG